MPPGQAFTPDSCSMADAEVGPKRRVFRWSREARQLTRDYRQRMNSAEKASSERRILISKLVEVSGNPRDACLRFLRLLGIKEKRDYRAWTKPEQQRLADLITSMPVEEAARVLRRPPTSVRSMLHRLGISGAQGRDYFTRFSLARALRTRCDIVQRWIDWGWLQTRVITSHGVRMHVIHPDDFCEFVRQHGHNVVGGRLSEERLWFVCNYVFPPSHASLFSLRGTYKKRSGEESQEDQNTPPQPEYAPEADADEENSLDQSA
jgi:hypothetical protein